ncbi:MAG TPA: hypothetical protein VMT79_20230 [Candidatus Binatia bacterium]|nr:hypothetical protein [Candidatus Binatia bacterium]
MIAPDPFKTETPISKRGMTTYKAIAARLAALQPPIYIDRHIAQSEQQGKTQFSTLDAHDATLDGINFIAAEPARLVSAFERAQDTWGFRALASMKEAPDHWALKASFGKTIGTGWREEWREAPYTPPATVPEEPGRPDNMFKMRFGTAGNPIRFTALHCAVHEIGGQCNVHIDESGFVLSLPRGISLTPDLYDHIMNELKLKTDFRDWLSGMMPNATAARIVKEVIRRVAITFPNASNGYAGLDRKINSIRRPRGPGDVLLTAGRLLAPIGLTVDVYDNDRVKVQVTGTILNGDRSITVSIGGEW